MKVGGLTPFTSVDYPGQVAAVVFVQGCPWRCSYCHNPQLQARAQPGALEWAQVLAWLQRRTGLLDAVVFSGGEPTLEPALASALRDVRALGFAVGLHTAGTHPQRLQAVLPWVDWVGMDVKAPFSADERYQQITGMRASAEQARHSAALLLDSGVAHEFRTTVHPSLLSDEELLRLGQELAALGAQRYVLQACRVRDGVLAGQNEADLAVYPQPATLARLRGLFANFSLRSTSA